MNNISEYNTKPRMILVCNPDHITQLHHLSGEDIRRNNFMSIPNDARIQYEFNCIMKVLQQSGVTVVDIYNLVPFAAREAIGNNPNSMFVRDPIITFPWDADVAILSKMSLRGRMSEPQIIRACFESLGINTFITPSPDVHIEGGDIVMASENGQRVVYVGVGKRTNQAAAYWLATILFTRGLADKIVCIRHSDAFLHLDTCFNILPNNIITYARGSLRSGFAINVAGEVTRFRITKNYLKKSGYKMVSLSKESALNGESCNMIYLGNNRYLSFNISRELRRKIETLADISIIEVEGSEIAKANGGVHCLTKQVY